MRLVARLDAAPEASDYGHLDASRYIAMNRFQVRNGASAKFEKRWADRKSRLAHLDGFRLFALLRRVTLQNSDAFEGQFGNYVSCTVWEGRDDFEAWRTGDAFKEAHGGGGISGFLGLLKTALFILEGGPKPAFYEGLSPQSTADNILSSSEIVAKAGSEGWRSILADGENLIPADSFCEMKKYRVPTGQEESFELALTAALAPQDGLLFYSVMRRDGGKAEDGYTYTSFAAFEDKEKLLAARSALSTPDNCVREDETAYYEGKLTMVCPKGA